MTSLRFSRSYLLFIVAAVAWTFIDRYVEDHFINPVSMEIAAIVLCVGIAVAGFHILMWLPFRNPGFLEVEARCGTAVAEAVIRGLEDAKAGRFEELDLSTPIDTLLANFRAYQEHVDLWLNLKVCGDGSCSVYYSDPSEIPTGGCDLYKSFDSIEAFEEFIA